MEIMNIGNNPIDKGRSDLESIKMSDKDINKLIDSLCDTRAENSDVVLYDNIINSRQNGYYDELEEQALIEKESIDIENEILDDIFKSIDDKPLESYELNSFDANGLYDRYIKQQQQKESNIIYDDNDDISKEIAESLKNKPVEGDIIYNNENDIQTAQEREEIDMNINDDSIFQESEIIDIKPEEIIEDKDINLDSAENIETLTAEEEYTPLTEEEMNDVEAVDITVTDSILHNIADSYNLSDEDAIKFIDVIRRYKNKEKFNVFEELPEPFKIEINKQAMSVGADRSIINFFAKTFINSLISDNYIDQEIKNFNKEMEEALKPMGNIVGSLIDEYNDNIEEMFTTNLYKKSDEIKDKDPEKSAQLIRIADNFKLAHSMDRIKNMIKTRPSICNRAYKDYRDRWVKITEEFNEKFGNVEPKLKSLNDCFHSLYKSGYEKDVCGTIMILVYYDICNSMKENTLEEHIYSYYILNAIFNLCITANGSNLINTASNSIEEIANSIREYMSSLPQRKKKKR